MITRVNYYFTETDCFKTLEEAQSAELISLYEKQAGRPPCEDPLEDPLIAVQCVRWIMENKDAVLDVLTTTPTSKPRARRINGGKKERKAASNPGKEARDAVRAETETWNKNAALQDSKQ